MECKKCNNVKKKLASWWKNKLNTYLRSRNFQIIKCKRIKILENFKIDKYLMLNFKIQKH